MISISVRQKEFLYFIKEYMIKNDGLSPSYKEIADRFGYKSTSSVHRIIHSLVERQWIRLIAGKSRCIELIAYPNNTITIYLPEPFPDETELSVYYRGIEDYLKKRFDLPACTVVLSTEKEKTA